jgi:hypothetical protein
MEQIEDRMYIRPAYCHRMLETAAVKSQTREEEGNWREGDGEICTC